MSECSICVANTSLRLGAKTKLKATATLETVLRTNLKAVASINTKKMQQLSSLRCKLSDTAKLKPSASLSENIFALKPQNNATIVRPHVQLNGILRSKALSSSELKNKYVDKFSGYLTQINAIKDFASVQKLYPISDDTISLNNSSFVNKYLSSDDLYDSINEGIFTGNYNENFNISNRISDDNDSYIQPSSVFTSGTFRYKCEVSRPYHHPKNSFLFLRAAAPLSNYGSNVPPEYRIHNIKLEDPSGNLIVQYKDIVVRGDADYSDTSVLNYATYISEPEINNANLHSWDEDYPLLGETGGYTLNMDFDVVCLDDPFDIGFNTGYEERACALKFSSLSNNDYLGVDGSPLSTQTQGYHLNPTNTIRISSVEICNSGELCSTCSISGIKQDNYFGFYVNVTPIGERLSRTIYPSQVLLNSNNLNIYPVNYSTWESSPDENQNTSLNTSASGSQVLTSKIIDESEFEYITLVHSNPISDSGRLTLKFSHKPPLSSPRLINGSFDFSSDTAFDRADYLNIPESDNFFTIDSLELKVIAKKAVGSRDYVLDIVGYSDDRLLNVTPKLGAFLQNSQYGSGSVPLSSGLDSTNELGISSETISDKDQYFERYLTSVDAGDHYRLSTLPVINSTSYEEYTIPLTIYEDFVSLGKSIDYSMSSYFENLFVDIYPIPSGASVASVRLVVNYKPSNGILLHTFGRPLNKELGKKDIRLLPQGVSGVNDIKLNSDYDDAALSVISNIPQGYSEHQTLKTNYARRWRGVDGNVVNGPYNPNSFDFSFYNPIANHPFLNGLYNFNNVSGNFVISDDYSSSGLCSSSPSILKNIGLRFKNQQLFPHNTNHTTIDWSQSGDPLYGKIADAFDSAIRISGQNYINFGNLPLSTGFSIYLRFTPDYNHDFTNSSLFSIWDNVNNRLVLSAGFSSSSRLKVVARDTDHNLQTIESIHEYDTFQYPLSMVLCYDKNPNGTLTLFARNELDNTVDLLDLRPLDFDIDETGDLIFGYNPSYGVSGNYFAHEIGVSHSGNLVFDNPNKLFKQTTVKSFLDSHSHSFDNTSKSKFQLHSFIDDDTSSWKLGNFKICSFSPDFDGFTKRIGNDYLIHSLKHSGSGYTQTTNLTLPSSIYASGVSYHSQLENDFLRFNLQDLPDANPEFYAVPPRICKNLPRDYNFAERAMVVDTIIEHETDNDFVWEDGSVGAKLIVSLYSKNQDPVDRPSKVNWGLINRSIHYLKPSGCYEKLSSTFNYNDLLDISEPWARFDLDNIRSEFDHKYYSTDINDMFLQYDLVYPSGSPFESTIKIHSANVRLEDALTYWADSNNQVNLYSSGEAIRFTNMNMFTVGLDSISDSGLSLYTNGSPWSIANGSVNLCVSGVFGIPNSQFSLFVKNSGIVESLGPNIYVSGGSPRVERNLPLVMIDNTLDQTRYNSLPITVQSKGLLELSDSMPLTMAEVFSTRNLSVNASTNLTLYNEQIVVNNANANTNLYINTDLDYASLSGTFSLYTINYLAYNQQVGQQSSITWNKNSLGTSIDPILDADVPYLDANDEIRGVELICYGDCNSNNKCQENPIELHDVAWYGSGSCVDGGIFRAKNTYTNLDTSGFKTEVGYSGHFYGIRKYEGLIPYAPYNVTITTKSGTNNPIKVPSEYVELDYGSNEYVNYSGIKLTADRGLSSAERSSGDRYGKAVAVKYDLMGVSAPMQTISYSEYDTSGTLITTELEEAGSVYLYRRNPRPSGYNWSENQHKSDWLLETKLTLPSGLLKDYPTIVNTSNVDGISFPTPVPTRYWNVGQEGRQFGHSLDIGVNNNLKSFQENKREIVVVGGPSAKWSRDFEDLSISGVSIGLIVFTDEFSPTIIEYPSSNASLAITKTYENVLQSIANKDLIFSYFSDPPVKFNVKLIICEPKSDLTNTTSLDFPEPKPSFIVKKTIPRNQGIVTEEDTLAVFSGIKSAFEEAFPYDTTKIHNNIPVMLGVYVDNSRSLGRSSVEPGIDRFLSYYQDYSFASGLQDFYGVQSSGFVYEYDSSESGSEDWIALSQTVFNELLDTGRLVRDNQIRFFASGVGPDFFNVNLSQFNYPPNSGGRVYVFEKESGSWNLIQEIKSPIVSYDTLDRFGHAVAISEDTTVIGIGSPYINECCKIYEYKPSEKHRLLASLYSWLPYKSSLLGGVSNKYLTLIEDYQEWVATYGTGYANEILYSKLTSTEKFEARQFLNINEYQNIFTYTYDNIPYTGETWEFIPQKFAPSSRLGYSVAVNDDGSTVAFGAPTDSFNAFDDYNVYYANEGYNDPQNYLSLNGPIKPSWRSNVNSGAVRLFESRKYYPHSGVVEFGKFGNLQESLNHPQDSGHFNYIASIFQDKNFRKMGEDEVSIPTDAGLAFIITPGEDALSDEVMDNIISWLSLGDRNLVLVGNDPIWEEGGIYKKSNDILNNILARLNSRLRLVPARNQYESLPSGSATVVPSMRPRNGISTHILPFELNTASGVADIRMHFPDFSLTMPCPDLTQDGIVIVNTKCELPLANNGDLRAQWFDYCIVGDPPRVYTYPINWPFLFRTFIPESCLTEDKSFMDGTFDLPERDAVPLLAAAEVKTVTSIIPARPAVYNNVAIMKDEIVTSTTTVTEFINDEIASNVAFIWDSGNPSGYSLYEANINEIKDNTDWYKPVVFSNRQSLLQASAEPKEELVFGTELVASTGLYCVEQSYPLNNTSSIIAIAGTATEAQEALYSSSSDRNINFYANLVSKTVRGESNIAQLGAWTGRSSFQDGYAKSILRDIFINTGNDVYEDVVALSPLYNVCWIANPVNLPSQEDITNIKAWLNTGNKKIIITNDGTLEQALKTQEIFKLLDTNIKLLYLPVKEEYYYASSNFGFAINPYHYVYNGFNRYSISNFRYLTQYYSFATAPEVIPVAYNGIKAYDNKPIVNSYFRLNTGIDKVVFPAIPGSGYRIFITTVSEYPSENLPFDVYVNNVSDYPNLPISQYPGLLARIQENSTYEEFKLPYGVSKRLESTIINKPLTISFNVQVDSTKNDIEFYFNALNPKLNETSYVPKTCRLLAISGVPVPVRQRNVVVGTPISYPIGYREVKISDPVPEQIITKFVNGAISSLNDRYCFGEECFKIGFNNQLIEDGPVVAAQEICFASSFNAGVARSRITVLSDSNLVQGRYIADEFGRLSQGTTSFIRSLYPETNFSSTNSGRQYTEFTKIVSPERGSPQKYLSTSFNIGLNRRFGPGGSTASSSQFSDKESLYDPRYVLRPIQPWPKGATQKVIDAIKNEEIEIFRSQQQGVFGGTAKFSGVIEGTMYEDVGIAGGIPQLMKDTGHDYLDFDRFPSGYPGDLFGYSISLHKNKLVIGSPFSAFSSDIVNTWQHHINNYGSEIETSYNGGAGSAYIFEKTNKGSGVSNTLVPWQFTQKLRPTNINVGQDIVDSGMSQSYDILGPNTYTSGSLVHNTKLTDQFGYDVSIDSDIIVVGAPGHDFDKSTENVYSSGNFIRKSFNSEFDIPSRIITDYGYSGVRYSLSSGTCILNNGAIFTFENKINDWSNRLARWIQVEKIVPQDRQQNQNENDYFGRSVYVHRSFRSDADYTVIGGCEHHDYSNSGTDIKSMAGAAYTNDIILRESPPSLPNQNTFIDIRVFGEITQNGPVLTNKTTNTIPNQIYRTSGIIYSNKDGAIFLEASGQDPSSKGFIEHRPYIVSIDGLYNYGTENSGNIPLFIDGNVVKSENMDLYLTATTGNVYSSIGLYSSSIVDFGSGNLNFYTDCPEPTQLFASGLTLFTASGVGISTDTLNMRIRGY